MRSIIAILAAAIVLVACSSPQHRAQQRTQQFANRCTTEFGLSVGQPGYAECVLALEDAHGAKSRWFVSEMNRISNGMRRPIDDDDDGF